jgi:hypothetical protein
VAEKPPRAHAFEQVALPAAEESGGRVNSGLEQSEFVPRIKKQIPIQYWIPKWYYIPSAREKRADIPMKGVTS